MLAGCQCNGPTDVSKSPATSATAVSPDSKDSWSLKEALDNKFVQVMMCGIGVSTGLSVVMAIKSAAASPLKIRVDSGTVLRSGTADAQDMIVHRVERGHDLESSQEIAKKCLGRLSGQKSRLAANRIRSVNGALSNP